MELVINISKWPEDSPLEHIRTDIIIKDKNDGIIIEQSITSLVYVKEIDIPVGETYYVTEKKVFNVKGVEYGEEDDISYESIVHTITNNDEAISNMLLSKPVIIEKPMLLLTNEQITNSEDTITIRSSSYRGSGDGHTHTHWLIYIDGILKVRSVRDTVNKTNIVIPKEVFADYNSILEIHCTHCSNYIESETEIYTLTKNSLNFKVVSNLINIPISSYNLEISKLKNTLPMQLSKVVVKHSNVILRTFIVGTSDANTININLPIDLIEPTRYLTLELYGYDEDMQLDKKTYVLKPYNLSYEDSLDKNFVYTKTFTTSINEDKLPKGLVTDLLGKLILVPNDTSMDLFSINGRLNKVNTIPTINHLGNKENMYIKVNNDNTILIDCLDEDNVPTFLIYSYDTLSDAYILNSTLTRSTETHTVAFNNSIEQISNDEFIYSVKGTNRLVKYNKKTNVTTDLKVIPLEDTTDAVILKMDDNQLLILGNNSYHTAIYNIEDNRYIEGMVINFDGYVGESIKKVDLVNGDKLLIINKPEENLDKVLYFDISKYTLEELDFVISRTDNNILFRYDNSMAIATVLVKDFVEHLVDRFETTYFR